LKATVKATPANAHRQGSQGQLVGLGFSAMLAAAPHSVGWLDGLKQPSEEDPERRLAAYRPASRQDTGSACASSFNLEGHTSSLDTNNKIVTTSAE
jgi:hypothetical protein